jgi:SAM-dependent methyltransferase
MTTEASTRLLYRQDQLPALQNRMYDTEAEAQACPKGDVRLVEDLRTGLVRNAAFRPELVEYDARYQNEQAASPHFRAHLDAVSDVVDRCLGRDSIVEVGCGKGFFVELLLARGFDVVGFDPTYEGTNPKVMRHFFGPGVGIKARGLVLRHVLEHIQDPFRFLAQLRDAAGGRGRIYIEVPCFDWICERRAWFDVFYEHVNYFRLPDFHRMFGDVVESGRLFGGQYLFVVAELGSLRAPVRASADSVVFPEGFADRLGSREPDAGPATIWGGASKGVIFALLRARAGRPIGTVIDINPAKQGKYLPATGLLVQSPAQALLALPRGSTIYVMNSNYMEEIRHMSNGAFHYVDVDHE